MAALRLQHEALQQKRDAVVALARHAARNAVRRQLQAQGVKVALVPLSLISAQANVYLLAHSAKLFAQARATAERWAAQSVRGRRLISPTAECTSTGRRATLRARTHSARLLAHYQGHRNLQSTARYTALAPDRFARFWQD